MGSGKTKAGIGGPPWRIGVVVLLIGLMVFSAVPCQAGKTKKAKAPKARHLTAAQKEIPSFVAFKAELEKFLGVPYRFGGTGPSGMDCSGFAKRLFAEAFGIDLPHNSGAISRLAFLDDLSDEVDDYRPSDLLFFGTAAKGKINHMGIYLGEGKFIHASRHHGVMVSSLERSYWKRRLLASKRVKLLDDAQLTTLAGGPAGQGLPLWAGREEPLFERLTLGYRQDLIQDRLSLGLEGFYGNDDTPSPVLGADGPGGASDDYQGWRALLEIQPTGWLRIMPWLGQLDVTDGLSGTNGALGYYGLKTRIGHSLSPWSLSMAAQTTHFHEFFAPSAGAIDEWRSLDLAFDLGYRLGRNSSLSVSGGRSGQYSGADADLPDHLSDVALHLNIEF